MELCPKCKEGLISKNSHFQSYICNKCETHFPIYEIEYKDVIDLLKESGVKISQIGSVISVANKSGVTPKELKDFIIVIKTLSED